MEKLADIRAADTTSVLTTAEDRVLRVIQTFVVIMRQSADQDREHDADGNPFSFSTPRAFAQPDSVNAAMWYPSASMYAPETYCFVASVRDTPVRLIDASDGRVSLDD